MDDIAYKLKLIQEYRLTSFAMIGTASHNLWLVRCAGRAVNNLVEEKLMPDTEIEQLVNKLISMVNKQDVATAMCDELVDIDLHAADKLQFYLSVAIQEKLGGGEDADEV